MSTDIELCERCDDPRRCLSWMGRMCDPTPEELKRQGRTRALATLSRLVDENKDVSSTLFGILDDAILADLEYLRDEIAEELKHAGAMTRPR